MSREKSLSITAVENEYMELRTLAKAEEMKPAAFLKHLIYQGLEKYFENGQIHPLKPEDDLRAELERRVATEQRLQNALNRVIAEDKARARKKAAKAKKSQSAMSSPVRRRAS